MRFIVLLLTALLVVGKFVILTAGSVSTGSFSLSSQLTSSKRKKLESLKLSLYDKKLYSKWDKEREEFSLSMSGVNDEEDVGVDASTLLQIIHRVLKGSGVYIDPEEKCKATMNMQLCIIELPKRIMGVNSFVLKSSKDNVEAVESNDESVVVEMEYWTPKIDDNKATNSKLLPKSLRLKVRIEMEAGEMTVSVQTSSSGLPKKTIRRIMKVTRKFWQTRLEGEVQVAIARKEQMRSLSKISKSAEKIKNAKRLDRIAYPEKYKQQSPSVRKEGVATYSSSSATGSGSTGSGRYKPGAAAAARTAMRKGG
jgi:hypothetical protein